MKLSTLTIALLTTLATQAIAESNHQPYEGLDARDIASLTSKDIEELQSGAGWGLALPAELNGYPGPSHLLGLQAELDLSEIQVSEMQAIYDAMKSEAVIAGHALIDAERSLDQGFQSGELTPNKLREQIAATEAARANLRMIHLSRHLQSIELLSPEQISAYSTLRGYTADL